MKPLLKDKIIVMTGATSGLGRAACLDLANKGAQVIILARSRSKSEQLIKELSDFATPKKGTISYIKCDFLDLNQVNTVCDQLLEKYERIDYLLNNAGLWNFSESKSVNGIEATFQVNVLVPLLLVKRLLPLLKKSKEAKVITTASALHQGTVNYSDVQFNTNFSSFKAYRQSKLMVILLTRLYATLDDFKGIKLVTQHPGVVDTGLARNAGWFARFFFRLFGKSPEKGARTLIYLVEEEADKLINGGYYVNSKPHKTSTAISKNLDEAKKVEELCTPYLASYIS